MIEKINSAPFEGIGNIPYVLQPRAIKPLLYLENVSIAHDYEGIPLCDIVAELRNEYATNPKKQAEPTNGYRTPTWEKPNAVEKEYFWLVKGMRYLTNFYEAAIFENLPSLDIPRATRVDIIRAVLKVHHALQVPIWLQKIISKCKINLERNHQMEADGTKATNWLANVHIPTLPQMPAALKLICSKVDAAYRPSMIIASLPILGTLATHVRFDYLDGNEHSFSFLTCITAPQASGKSFIRRPMNLLLRPIDEQDKIERGKERRYQEEKQALVGTGQIAENPNACPRNIGGNITIPKLLQLMENLGGKHAIMITEEIDALQRNDRRTHGGGQDIFRLAFDNGKYGQVNMGNNSINAHVPIYLNLLATGTPYAMYRYFKDPEGGLVSRVAFIQLPDTRGEKMPYFGKYTEEEEMMLYQLACKLMETKGTLYCDTVNRAIENWLEEKRKLFLQTDNDAVETLRRRAAVIGFRAGYLAHCMANIEADYLPDCQDINEADEMAANFAQWVAETVFINQMQLFGKQIEAVSTDVRKRQMSGGAVQNLFHELPHEFTRGQLIEERIKNNQSKDVEVVLYRWKKQGMIEKTDRGTYRKLTSYAVLAV